ncbi:MAG: DUF5067 domain-containing protein [Lactococcus sp.]|jgi:hypothetical protein
MNNKRNLSGQSIIIAILSTLVVALLALLLFNRLMEKKSPALTSNDFSDSAVKSASQETSATQSSLNVTEFDLTTKTFTGNFGKLTLKNITTITETHDDDVKKDAYLKLDFSLTNTSAGDLSAQDVFYALILQQDEGIFEKAERLEPIDRDDYVEFSLDEMATHLTVAVKPNTTIEGFIIYDLESNTKPVQFSVTNGEKVFEFNR